MSRQDLSQEFGIAYYRTMSKMVQFRRNVVKNSISSIQANVLANKVVQEVLQ
jgi:hypothetical protein